jgi:hypothetical protein
MEILKAFWANRLEIFSECLEDFSLATEENEFYIVIAAVLLVIVFGTGLSKNKLTRAAFVLGTVAVGAVLCFGVSRGEAGEVLFNGTLL